MTEDSRIICKFGGSYSYLGDTMKLSWIAESEQEIIDWVRKTYPFLNKYKIVFVKKHYKDDRIGWNDMGYIGYEDPRYEVPQHLGDFCKLNKVDKNKPWNAEAWKDWKLC